MRFLKRHKKKLILGVFAVFALGSLGLGLVGFMAYQAVSLVANRVQTSPLLEKELPVALTAPGFLEETVQRLATGWVNQQMNQPDLANLKNGLACLDAVGGPNPQRVITYLQQRVGNETAVQKLTDLKAVYAREVAVQSGPTACANWILSG